MSPVFRHGRLRLYLLRLLDEEPRHGYEVIRLLRDRFMGVYAPSPGTIYPRLARLEEEGLVTHDEENGRKVYRITEAGREELRNRGDELDELEEELSASVSDIVREVREDVRETVRNLREELTWAAREMRRTERGTREDARDQVQHTRDTTREQSEQARDAAREQIRQARDAAVAQARQVRDTARQARDQARQARDEAMGRANWLREEAMHLGDDTKERFRSAWEQAADEGTGHAPGHGTEAGPGDRESGERADRQHAGHDWGGWSGWGRWGDWPGRRNWTGPKDMGAFRDLERLARDFATDLRKVAWDSGALGGDVLGTLRDILEDTLDRIRTEVFGPDDKPPAENAKTPTSPEPDPPAPGETPAD
jgi:DNA-binding PadR family transcriptional regulator